MLPLSILFLNLGTGEIFIIIIVIVMFFGTKNLPELARGLGKGMRDFREAANNIQREIAQGAEEMKKNLDLEKEMGEIRTAANVMQGHIQEGLNNIEKNVKEATEETKVTTSETPQLPESTTINDPVAPAADVTATTTTTTTIQPDADSDIPGAIKRN